MVVEINSQQEEQLIHSTTTGGKNKEESARAVLAMRNLTVTSVWERSAQMTTLSVKILSAKIFVG